LLLSRGNYSPDFRVPPVVITAARTAHAEPPGDYSPNLRDPILEDAVPFLEALLTGVPGNQFLEIRTIAKGGASRKRFHAIDTLREQGIATALPLYLDGKENIYYGVAPRYERREAKTDDDRGDAVSLATAVWFDEIKKPPPDLPPFSWMVETSFNKVQGGYFLTAPTADLERVERLNKRLGAAVGGDNVWNRGRILRLPGFINAKYEGQQRSYLVEFHPERRYTLEELERLLPPLPARDDADVRDRTYDGPFNPHHGDPLPDDVKERFLDYLKGLGLTRNADGRYRGPCPFPHENGPSDGEASFYISPISGTWHCFGSSHEGARSGGVQAFRPLGFRVQLPQYVPNPDTTRKLGVIKRGTPLEEAQGKGPTPDSCHHYQGYVDECWPIHSQRRRSAARNRRPDRLTGEIQRHWDYLGANTQSKNAEFHYIVFPSPNVPKLCISMEHPILATPDLEALLVAWLGEKDVTGETTPAVRRLRECGQGCKWVCDDHGEKMRGFATCGLPYDPFCLTDVSRDLDKARLPDLDPETGEAYRSAWLLGRYALPADLAEWKAELIRLQELWEKSIGNLQRRKAVKNMLHWRSFTVYYTEDEALIHWKVMVKESAPGAADKALAALGATMGAEMYDDRRYVHGELASLQLVENARSHLLGFSRDLPWDSKLALFGAHYEATKGRHVFQALGPLKPRLAEVRKKREPLKCDECGKKLRQILVKEGDSPGPREEVSVGNSAYGRSPPGDAEENYRRMRG
jgi:hypothetical protein